MTHSVVEVLRTGVAHYGYWAVAGVLLLENVGVPLPGETILLLASFLAYSERELQLPWIIGVATIAATLGDNLGFALGYYGGRRLLEGYQSLFRIRQDALLRGERLFARFGAVTVFFARFIFGLRIVAGPLAGVLRMPWRKFLVFNFLGAIVWVTVISGTGYLFGRHWERLEQLVRRFDLGVVVLLLLALALFLLRRRRESTE